MEKATSPLHYASGDDRNDIAERSALLRAHRISPHEEEQPVPLVTPRSGGSCLPNTAAKRAVLDTSAREREDRRSQHRGSFLQHICILIQRPRNPYRPADT